MVEQDHIHRTFIMVTHPVHSITDDMESSMNEGASLLPQHALEEEYELSSRNESASRGTATVGETILNQAKLCTGTGCLALPFAAQQGGYAVFILATLGIAVWNVASVRRLVACQDLLDALALDDRAKNSHVHARRSQPPAGTSKMSSIAFEAFGGSVAGIWVVDFLMFTLLLGVIVAYLSAMHSFLQDTQLHTGSSILDMAILCGVGVVPLSNVSDMGKLSRGSAYGMIVLLGTLVILAVYGVFQSQNLPLSLEPGPVVVHVDSVTEYNGAPSSALPWWPPGIQNDDQLMQRLSYSFGCVVFGFGVVPMTFHFRDCMAEPSRLHGATAAAMTGVALSYLIVGGVFGLIYPELQGDLLHALPVDSWMAMMVRFTMTAVVLVTVPLLVVPCGELVEGKLEAFASSCSYNHASMLLRTIVRSSICVVAAAISLWVPGFVTALSLVGCASVTIVGFCIPFLLHGMLGYRYQRRINVVDILVFTLGLVVSMVSTASLLYK